MVQVYLSLLTALAVAAVSPFVASFVPGRAIPQVVFLVFGGAFLGKYGLGLIDPDLESIELVSDLGMGFLFLMAGYEINPDDLLGHTGRVATGSWLVSLVLAYGLVAVLFSRMGFDQSTWMALAICMTTTAYGTLAPIMHDRHLLGTRVGTVVSVYGSLGELMPIIAMSFLLSSRSMEHTAALLVIFVLVCLLVYLFSARVRSAGTRFWNFLVENAGGSSQPLVRMVALLLVFLLFATAAFDFEAALGAFAAGFILKALFPNGNEAMEEKIEVVSNGFFQPVFFVVSGASIDLAAATQDLPLLVGFILALVATRGLVIAATLKLDPSTRDMDWREVFSASAYCTMALPLVVAITNIALDTGIMGASTASVLVTAAALTVLLIPTITSFVRVVDEADPVEAARELSARDGSLTDVVQEHLDVFHERQRAFHAERAAVHQRGGHFSSAEYFAEMARAAGEDPFEHGVDPRVLESVRIAHEKRRRELRDLRRLREISDENARARGGDGEARGDADEKDGPSRGGDEPSA